MTTPHIAVDRKEKGSKGRKVRGKVREKVNESRKESSEREERC